MVTQDREFGKKERKNLPRVLVEPDECALDLFAIGIVVFIC